MVAFHKLIVVHVLARWLEKKVKTRPKAKILIEVIKTNQTSHSEQKEKRIRCNSKSGQTHSPTFTEDKKKRWKERKTRWHQTNTITKLAGSKAKCVITYVLSVQNDVSNGTYKTKKGPAHSKRELAGPMHSMPKLDWTSVKKRSVCNELEAERGRVHCKMAKWQETWRRKRRRIKKFDENG